MNDLYSIGDFSRMCRITVKALRLYDEQGILKPGHVDPSSGYRYYSSAQLPEALVVRRLRDLDMPLDALRSFLREDDPAARQAILDSHRRRVEERAAEYLSYAASISRMIEEQEGVMENVVEIKELADQNVVGMRFKTDIADIGANIGKAYEALFGYLGRTGAFPSGPPVSVYYDEEYKEEGMDVESCVPTMDLLPGDGDVKGHVLAGGKVASTLHAGPYDQVGKDWDALMAWISENGWRPKPGGREIYLVGPGQTEDPAEFRTELACPVEEA